MKVSTDNSVIINRVGHEAAMNMIREAGFDGIDYTFYDIHEEHNMLHLPDSERRYRAKELGLRARSIGLSLPQSHAELKYKYGIIADRAQDPVYDDIIKSLECSSLMGIPQVVVHTVRCPNSWAEDDIVAYNLDFMKGFIPYAEKYGVIIGVENLFARQKDGTFRGRQNTAESMNAFVDALGNDCFRVCCDLGHAAITGTDPEDFIAGMNPDRLTMLHVQDTDYKDDRHWLPLLGTQHWDKITDALAAIDFSGYMNLEVLHYYEKFPTELLPEALKLAADTAKHLAKTVEDKKKTGTRA
ncbi:MAG: sugar phosphate isomerase/epimerase [Clostridia bacterium]|nr:sugar phosphate isomerase/epimerase [Clostridia bacterium]